MYCMIPDPFPSTAFGKGSAMPEYLKVLSMWVPQTHSEKLATMLIVQT